MTPPRSQPARALYDDVLAIAQPDGRVVGSPGHRRAREYLLSRLKENGVLAYDGESLCLPYSYGDRHFDNIVGVIPGSNRSLDPLLLTAHYDTCGPQPGADDNAAAISIILGSILELRAAELERDLLVAFFDAEEPPYFLSPSMGSEYFYYHQRKTGIHCAIVMDLVGHDAPVPGRGELLFITGAETRSGLAEIFKSRSARDGLIPVVVPNSFVGKMSDHGVFETNDSPFLFLSCGQWPHYHQISDTPEKLNYDKMVHIRNYVVELVLATASADLDSDPMSGDIAELTLAGLTSAFAEEFRDPAIQRSVAQGRMDMAVMEIALRYGLL